LSRIAQQRDAKERARRRGDRRALDLLPDGDQILAAGGDDVNAGLVLLCVAILQD
jgi:hypothetical protein